ncbi:HAD-IA family hydrolase [bacterium]|nr:HAD-IA family hydrolase [bacterium]
MTTRFAIFDMDGTLVDSRESIHSAMCAAYRTCGLPDPAYDRTRRVIGLGLVEAFQALEPSAPAKLCNALADSYRAAFAQQRETHGGADPLFDGAMDLLLQLDREGWILGVATGKSRRGLNHILDSHDLGRWFATHWCAEDGPGKPHPFMVEANMRAVGAAPDATVVIGDATHDVVMARAAGVQAIGVSWGFGLPDEMDAAGAHEIHHDFGSLSEALARFGREGARPR